MNYNKNQVVVHNQQELNAVPENYSGTILVELLKKMKMNALLW